MHVTMHHEAVAPESVGTGLRLLIRALHRLRNTIRRTQMIMVIYLRGPLDLTQMQWRRIMILLATLEGFTGFLSLSLRA
jgi:hypothetical protein